jgi:hypothetical protein
VTELLFLAVEQVIPPDHPVAILAIPLGLLFFGGSVILLLWSNYGLKKAVAIYGVALFGFCFFIGVFWWFGGPGIPPGLGISHLPGQAQNHYQDNWFPFEAGSPRSEFFPGSEDLDAYVSIEEYAGVAGRDQAVIQDDPRFASLAGSTGQAVEEMQEQFLPVDENDVAQIGSERREQYTADALAAEPDEAVRQAQPFFTAAPVGELRLRDDPETGVTLITQQFQTYATYLDADGIPLEPIPVGDPVAWFAFYDPGAQWIPSALWTVISLVLFLLSLFWLDRLEMRDKRLQTVEVEEAQDLQVPIAQ